MPEPSQPGCGEVNPYQGQSSRAQATCAILILALATETGATRKFSWIGHCQVDNILID